jgi:hypothetical protein
VLSDRGVAALLPELVRSLWMILIADRGVATKDVTAPVGRLKLGHGQALGS